MGQRASSTAVRLAIIKGWKANWYASKRNFARYLGDDNRIRAYLKKVFDRVVLKIVIERAARSVTVTLHTAKPGVVIGPGGQKVQEVRKALCRLVQCEVYVNVLEAKVPELSARFIAESIAKQIESRSSYKRTVLHFLENAMYAGALGVKVRIAGRLGGTEMARTVNFHRGRVPLQTFRADIDYAKAAVCTTYGIIGVQVWVFLHEVYGKRDLSLEATVTPKAQKKRYAT